MEDYYITDDVKTLKHAGSNRDAYDKNGTRIYNFNPDYDSSGYILHRDWNETSGNWSTTFHYESANMSHPTWLR